MGSLPGEDPREAARFVMGELPDLPHLAELPGRGPWADLTGRAVALLVDLPAQLEPSGWRMAARPGRDLRRAAGLLGADLDALEEAAQDYRGPLKLQVAGPWTLAATLELRNGDRVVADPGARRELGQSLAEGLVGHLVEVRRRVPGAALLLQLDEPSLPAVLAGEVPTVSRLSRVPPVPDEEAGAALRAAVAAAADVAPVAVHCCVADAPVALLASCGVAALSLDLVEALPHDDDALAEALDGGVRLLAGAVPSAGPAPESSSVVADSVDRVRSLTRRLGLAAERVPARVVVTPACGLAGSTPEDARARYRAAREVAQRLADDPAGG